VPQGDVCRCGSHRLLAVPALHGQPRAEHQHPGLPLPRWVHGRRRPSLCVPVLSVFSALALSLVILPLIRVHSCSQAHRVLRILTSRPPEAASAYARFVSIQIPWNLACRVFSRSRRFVCSQTNCPVNSQTGPASLSLGACSCSPVYSQLCSPAALLIVSRNDHCRLLASQGFTGPNTACTLCPLGSFKGSSGSQACTACPANETSLVFGATQLSQCLVS
jgi:hypothetical protein